MEQIIAKLLNDFEQGRMTRRQLIQTLALTATAVSSRAASASAADGKGFQAIAVNHISYGVADYAKTRDFYADLLGMRVRGDNGSQCSLAFGDTFILARKSQQPENKPFIDHIAITIDNWNKDAVESELTRRGLKPRPDGETSFHVNDPDGFDLQISGRRPQA
jgi:catechol 2,3-dioxygenase-like lactoylglutathione lyase family enzyme